MSISNTNQTGSSQLPRIVIGSYYDIPEINKDNVVVRKIVGNYKPQQVFNDMLQEKMVDIFGFLGPEDTIINPEEYIKKIIDTYLKYPFLNCIYSNNIANGHIQHFPSMTEQILNTRVIIETPFFFRQSPYKFNTDLTTLYFYDMLYRLAKMSTVYHIATPYIKTNKLPKNIDADLKIIYG